MGSRLRDWFLGCYGVGLGRACFGLCTLVFLMFVVCVVSCPGVAWFACWIA